MSDFKFNIKLTPIIKTKEWEYRRIQSGRTKKVCAFCERGIAIGQSSITFTKIEITGSHKKFDTRHGHFGLCSSHIALKLGFPLDEAIKIQEIK